MTFAVAVNGVDLGATYGWFPDGLPGWLDLPDRAVEVTSVPARYGGIAGRLEAGSRNLGLLGAIQATTPEARDATEIALERLFLSGLVQVQIIEGTMARQVTGYTRSLHFQPFNAGVASLASRVEATILCPDPVWRAVRMTGIAVLPSVRVTLPLGSAASDPVLQVMGPAVSPVFTLRDARGAPVGTPLSIEGTLGATEYMECDSRRGVIDLVTAGVRDNGAALLSGGTFPFALDPRRGPLTAEVSSGTAQLLYVQGWR